MFLSVDAGVFLHFLNLPKTFQKIDKVLIGSSYSFVSTSVIDSCICIIMGAPINLYLILSLPVAFVLYLAKVQIEPFSVVRICPIRFFRPFW